MCSYLSLTSRKKNKNPNSNNLNVDVDKINRQNIKSYLIINLWHSPFQWFIEVGWTGNLHKCLSFSQTGVWCLSALLPPAGTPSEAAPQFPSSPLLSGCPPEEVGLGSAEQLFAERTNQHEPPVQWFMTISMGSVSNRPIDGSRLDSFFLLLRRPELQSHRLLLRQRPEYASLQLYRQKNELWL